MLSGGPLTQGSQVKVTDLNGEKTAGRRQGRMKEKVSGLDGETCALPARRQRRPLLPAKRRRKGIAEFEDDGENK